MITSFPAAPRQMFRLLGKMDHAFASLLQGQDIETGERLPGFDFGRKVSTTEKVRIKSLIERTRVSVANAMSKGEFEEDLETRTPPEEGDLILDEVEDDHAGDENYDMQTAKVYDRTLVEIGTIMDGPAIGIRTEPYG